MLRPSGEMAGPRQYLGLLASPQLQGGIVGELQDALAGRGGGRNVQKIIGTQSWGEHGTGVRRNLSWSGGSGGRGG